MRETLVTVQKQNTNKPPSPNLLPDTAVPYHQTTTQLWEKKYLTLLLLNTACPVLANSVDPDQLASSEANWSGSALFVIKYVNFYQKPGSSNLVAGD